MITKQRGAITPLALLAMLSAVLAAAYCWLMPSFPSSSTLKFFSAELLPSQSGSSLSLKRDLPFQEKDLEFVLIEFHQVLDSPFLQPV